MSSRAARAIATVGGLGDLLPAPGTTVGSLVAAAAFAALAAAAPEVLGLAAALLAVAIASVAVWACGVEAVRRGESDPGAIVADEVAGQWLALAAVAIATGRPPTPPETAAGFVLFRLFDIVKPWPIGRLERLPGGWGIVADDLAAGAAAAVVEVAVIAALR